MKILELEGSPFDMGRAFGRACGEDIHALYGLRLANALEQAQSYGGRRVDEGWILAAARRCLSIVQVFSPGGARELEGIAAGAALPLEKVWAMNALTDLRDVAAYAHPELGAPAGESPEGEGCSSIVAPGEELLLGQTWDLVTDNMPFVLVVHRKPAEGPETLALTTTGCLSLIGINAHGVAVGTTNLRTTDARAGVGYLDVIHAALGQTSFEAAATMIRSAPRAGAHYFYLGGADGRALAFEGSAARMHEHEVSDAPYVHCNHALYPEIIELEAEGMPVASTHHRHARLDALARCGRIDSEKMRSFFTDAEGGPLAINRKGDGGISSNGSVVMSPSRRTLWAVHGPADEGRWVERTLPALG